jgi:hypothetical protein
LKKFTVRVSLKFWEWFLTDFWGWMQAVRGLANFGWWGISVRLGRGTKILNNILLKFAVINIFLNSNYLR